MPATQVLLVFFLFLTLPLELEVTLEGGSVLRAEASSFFCASSYFFS